MELSSRLVEVFKDVSIYDERVPIHPGTSLEDYGLDSLDFLELIMAIETEFEINIPDEAFDINEETGMIDFSCVSLGVLQRMIEERVGHAI